MLHGRSISLFDSLPNHRNNSGSNATPINILQLHRVSRRSFHVTPISVSIALTGIRVEYRKSSVETLEKPSTYVTFTLFGVIAPGESSRAPWKHNRPVYETFHGVDLRRSCLEKRRATRKLNERLATLRRAWPAAGSCQYLN